MGIKKSRKGYTQVYTGNGKGKTTAAIGLAIRAAGAGLKVFIAQFIKMGDYSEIKALKRFSDLITVEQFGLGRFSNGKPSPEDIEAAQKGLHRVRAVMVTDEYDIIIMEEANVAVMLGLFAVQDLGVDMAALFAHQCAVEGNLDIGEDIEFHRQIGLQAVVAEIDRAAGKALIRHNLIFKRMKGDGKIDFDTWTAARLYSRHLKVTGTVG